MLFKVEIDTSNDAFDGSMTNVADEIERMISKALTRMVEGAKQGALLDVNGNTVGNWWYEEL